MKRILLLICFISCIIPNTFAMKAHFNDFFINLSPANISEMYVFTPDFIDISYENGDRYTYQYRDLSNINDVSICLKYFYLPNKYIADNHAFTKKWVENWKNNTKLKTISTIPIPERRGIISIEKNKAGDYLLNSIYIDNNKLYYALLYTSDSSNLEYRARLLMNTIYPK